MTPKEKAREILLSYSYILNDTRIAKRCAIIAVDHILKAIGFNENLESIHKVDCYWIDVKNELENN